jgi:feruloyl-CoA synthase
MNPSGPATPPATPAEPARYRAVDFGPYDATLETRADGTLVLRATEALGAYPVRFTEHLLRWAAERPHHTFLARRGPGPNRAWLRLSYADTLQRVRALAQALLDHGLSVDRPLVVLSGNDFEHALLGLAAMHVGVPVAPVSPSYSLLDPAAARVVHAVALLTPGMVFAADGSAFANAINAAVARDTRVVLTQGAVPGRTSLSFAALQATVPTAAVDEAHARVHGDTVAKFLFTSGSTKQPKAVVNTHRMLCANQQQYVQCYPFLESVPPVLVDWLPWHHTAGGNSNFGLVLRNGGAMYIDEGKPTPDGVAETVANLREVSPTAICTYCCWLAHNMRCVLTTAIYTVPKGLEVLVQHMEHDSALRENVFKELRLVFAAGAAMPQTVIDLFDRLAVQTTGLRVPMTMGLGMTETAPFAVSHHRPGWVAGVIGLPAPGLELKLAPVADKLEVRYRGANISPAYWRQPELQAETYDDEGYLCSGDAATFIDPNHPALGLRFDGRIAEDFKLISGTWVSVSTLKARAMAAALPYVHDVVVTGDGRDSLGLLVFLTPAAARLSAHGATTPAALATDPGVRAWAQAWLNDLAGAGTGGSNRLVRAMLMAQPPSAATGELTDKGTLNQRTTLKLRAALVETLYADAAPDPRVLRAQTTASQPSR